MKTINIFLIMMLLMVSSVFAIATADTTMNVTTPDNFGWFTNSTPWIQFKPVGNDTMFNCSLTTNFNGSWYLNTTMTLRDVTNDTFRNITYNTTGIADNGTGYLFGVGCVGYNGTAYAALKAGRNITVKVDTDLPDNISILNINQNMICSDATPELYFNATTDTDFSHYNITMLSKDGLSNRTTRWYTQDSEGDNHTRVNISLPADSKSYNISIRPVAESGLSNPDTKSTYTKDYTHNTTGWDLTAGWNLYGIVRDVDVNLSTISKETGASTVAMYNNSAGTFVSYTTGTTNAAQVVKRTGVAGNASNNAVLLYMDAVGNWEGCGRNFSISQDYTWDVIGNNSNDNWNIINAKRDNLTFKEINTSLDGNVADVMSWYNNSNGYYISYFANLTFNMNTPITKGTAVWVRAYNTSSGSYNWTNQTTA